MERNLQLALALAHAYARGKKRREYRILAAALVANTKRKSVRGATAEQIMRRMARQEEK